MSAWDMWFRPCRACAGIEAIQGAPPSPTLRPLTCAFSNLATFLFTLIWHILAVKWPPSVISTATLYATPQLTASLNVPRTPVVKYATYNNQMNCHSHVCFRKKKLCHLMGDLNPRFSLFIQRQYSSSIWLLLYGIGSVIYLKYVLITNGWILAHLNRLHVCSSLIFNS